MGTHKVYRAIGLMSGTSLDGVDAALIETDGHAHVKPLGFYTFAYDPADREKIRAVFGQRDASAPDVRAAAALLTQLHARAAEGLLKQAKTSADDVDVIGFHGQTIAHDPDHRFTLQIGDGDALAAATGIDVVSDFRSADVKAGGQGAPFLPLYHRARALADGLPRPVAIVNIGGVANVTWIGEGDEILAFDTGPGNALMDDFVMKRTGQPFDAGGALANKGHSADYLLEKLYAHPYFRKKPPKSLDRDGWDVSFLEGLNDEDGLATLMVFTGETIVGSIEHMPEKPKAWYVAGGGRHNKALMVYIRAHLQAFFRKIPVEPVETLGWNGDALEAEGFAYLAVRSVLGLPLSLPETTAVPAPMTGGRLHKSPSSLRAAAKQSSFS